MTARKPRTKPFPIEAVRYLWSLNGYLPADRRFRDVVARSGERRDMHPDSIERVDDLDLRGAIAALEGAFLPGRGLERMHWLMWLACDLGIVRVQRERGGPTFVDASPFATDVERRVLDVTTAAFYYRYALLNARAALTKARAVINEEWADFWFRGGSYELSKRAE